MRYEKDKKRFYKQKNRSPQYQPVVNHEHKNKMSTRMKMAVAFLSIIILGGVAYWRFSAQKPQLPQTPQQVHPQTVAGKFYSAFTLSSDGTKTYFPITVIQNNELTFADLALESPTDEITYQGRTIPLNLYKSGKYLPLLIISTPSQKVIAGIRVCEPCGSFSFHIVEGKYLECDACNTKWDIETLTGVGGGCLNYPPPKLPTLVESDISVDISALGVNVTS